MATVLVLGSGMVVKPLVDYLIDTCGYRTILTDLTSDGAARLLRGRALGVAAAWTAGDAPLLHRLVQEADVVVSMLPPSHHVGVAEACLDHRRHLVTTSYISDAMAALDEPARLSGLVFLNEVGESPGLDHMSVMSLIREAQGRGEEIVGLRSYAGGLPAFRWNTNPWGYKFSWSPRGVFKAAHSAAVYLDRGEPITVAPEDLFDHYRLVDIDGVATFETYPNRDATRYLEPYGLDPSVSLYRGLLRHHGWCATMRAVRAIGLLDDTAVLRLDRMTPARFLAGRMGCDEANLQAATADLLGLRHSDPVMKRLEWLGLFAPTDLMRGEGTALDVFMDVAVRKLAYGPGEQDMVVVHNELICRERTSLRKHTATLTAEGIPGGDSAMSQAVGLTAGIATRIVADGGMTAHGVTGPWHDEIQGRILCEMARRGFAFHRKSMTIEP